VYEWVFRSLAACSDLPPSLVVGHRQLSVCA